MPWLGPQGCWTGTSARLDLDLPCVLTGTFVLLDWTSGALLVGTLCVLAETSVSRDSDPRALLRCPYALTRSFVRSA